MSNIITEAIAKIAGNVTQSVISAVIVFLITTYVLVGIGKREGGRSAADSTRNADAAKKEAVAPPSVPQNAETKTPADRREPAGTTGGTPKTPLVLPSPGSSAAGARQETVLKGASTPAEDKTPRKVKEAAPDRPRETAVTVKEAAAQPADASGQEPQAMERTAQETAVRHSKRDTAAVEKKAKEEVKKVKKRADEIFDELDQETGKNPPP